MRTFFAVTPCVGVWIETERYKEIEALEKSHPAWVCGLKQKPIVPGNCPTLSHPAWVCGLKHSTNVMQKNTQCHTLRGCVD